MADTNANININIDTSQALASIKALQSQISRFQSDMASSGAAASQAASKMQQNLVNSVNATKGFSAQLTTIKTTTESFTNALEKNKLSLGQYFRYAGGATKTFGKMFSSEFNTIEKVARERVKDLQTQYVKLGRNASGAMEAIKIRPLTLDMNDLGTKTAMAAQKQQLFNQLLKQGSTNLLNFGKNTQWAGRQLMVGFTIPLSILGTTAAREFQKIEEQAIKFRRVYGDMFNTDADTEKALKNVRDLADEFTKYGIAVEKTIELAAKVAQMGNTGDALEAQVIQATRLSVLGGLDQMDALDTTISLTNAFGVSVEDLATKINFLNAAENQTILSIEDFNTAIPLSGSVVKELGGSVEDLAFFLTAMREGGINASQGANALKSSLARLINPTTAAQQRLGEMGINVMGIVEGNAGNLRGTVLSLAYALDELAPLERSRAIEQLFGKFQFARMSTLLSNITDQGSQANRVLGLMSNSAEEMAILAERELGKVEESTATKFAKSLENLKASLAPIGEAFIKLVTPIVEFFTKVLEKFNNLSDGAKGFIVGITGLLGLVAPAALMVVGLIANGVANLIKFFALIGRGFQKTSESTTILGQQTSYMNQEQIEAAAVAASLDQVHSKLIQTFTSEAAAIQNLTGALQRAVNAQNAFRASGAGAGGRGTRAKFAKGKKPKGYNSGVLMVPGPKGAGDIIPAMVAPGESIIPADMTQRYAPLISAMIDGKIPGYEEGFDPKATAARLIAPRMSAAGDPAPMWIKSVNSLAARLQKLSDSLGSGRVAEAISQLGEASFKSASEALKSAEMQQLATERSKQAGPQFAHVTPDVRMSATEALKKNLSGQSGALVKDMASIPGLAGKDVRMQSGWGVDLDEKLNLALASSFKSKKSVEGAVGAAADPRAVFKDLSERGSKGWSTALSIGGLDPENMSAEVQKEVDGFHQRILGGVKSAMDNPNIDKMFDTDAQISELEVQAKKLGKPFDPARYTSLQRIEEEAAKGMDANLKMIREKAKNTIADVRVNISKADRDAAIAAESAGDKNFAGSKGFFNKYFRHKKDGPLRSSKNVAVRKAGGQGSFDEQRQEVLDKQAKDYNDGLAESAKTASESKRTKQIAKDTVDGYANELERGKKKIEKSAELSREKMASDRPVQPAYGGEGLTRRVALMRREQQQQKRIDQQNEKLYGTTGFTPAMRLERKRMESQAKLERAKMAQQKQLLAQETIISTRATQEVQKQNIIVRAKNRVLALRDRVLQKEMVQTTQEGAIAGKRGMSMGRGGMMGLGAIATTGVMMASSQEGAVGEIAQKAMPAVMALSMLPMIFPLLTNPLTALVAVIGTAAVGIYMMNEAFKKTQKESMEATRALGSSTDALRGLSEFAGTVSAGEYMDRVRENRMKLVGTQSGKTTFGEAFVENDQGVAMIESARKQLASSGSQSVINDLSGQLSTAIITGALSSEEASSIASNLAYELNDMSIGIQVRARIVELVGPNGENLSGNGILEFSARQNEMNMEQIQTQMNALNSNIADTPFGTQTQRNVGMGGMVAAGAGAGAGIGAGIGAIFAGPTAGLSVAIGAVGGTILGAIGGLMQANTLMEETNERVAAMSGAVVGTVMNTLDAQQEMSDALDAYYLKKIEEAKVQGDIAESLRLQAEYEQKKVEMSEQEMAMRSQLRSALEVGGEGAVAARTGIQSAIQTRFKDDAGAQLVLPAIEATMNRLQNMGQIDQTDKDIINLELATNLDPIALNNLLMFVGEDENKTSALVDIIGKFGGTFADETANTLNLIQDDDDLKAQLFIGISSAANEAEAQEALDFIREVGKQNGVLNTDVMLRYFSENSKAKTELENIFDKVDAEGVVTKEQAIAINPKLANPEAFDEEYFDMLPEGDKEQYVKTVSMILSIPEAEIVGGDDFKKWLGEPPPAGGMAFAGKSRPTQVYAYAQAQGEKVTKAMPAFDPTGNEEPAETTGGGGKKEDPYEDILKRLKNVRDASINAAGGAKELLRVLGSGKDIKIFGGVQQQLIGFGKEFADYIGGLDEETRKLFVTIKNGKVQLTELGTAMQRAFLKAQVGEFQLGLLQSLESIKNKQTAYDKLRTMGLDYADAIEIAKNETMALAIATGAISTKELKEVIRLVKEVKARSEVDEAFDNVRKAIQDFAREANAKSVIQVNYSSMEQDAILNDDTLMAMAKLGLYGANEFKERLAQVMSTIEFKQNTFDKGFNMAMEAFAAKEKEIELRFKVKKDPYLDIIRDAEEKISDIRNRSGGIDDLEADLERISWQEEEINKTYDERIKALDEVDKANAKIAQRQKQQLSIADALSQGDISAAARAAQDQRAQEAASASQKSRELLEKSRESSLGAVTGQMSLTREQIELRIRDLKREIFNIEESLLEPAQRQVELLERAEQTEIRSLEVLGRTKTAWETIKNGIDLAKTSSTEYENAMRAALAVVEDILNYWKEIEKPKTTVHTIVTQHSSGEPPEPSTDPVVTTTNKNEGKKKIEPIVVDKNVQARETKAQVERREMQEWQKQQNQKTATKITASVGGAAMNDPLGLKNLIPPNVVQKVNDWGKGVQNTVTNWVKSIMPKPAPPPVVKPAPKLSGPALKSALRNASGGMVPRFAGGGKVGYYPMGGLIPYKANGGLFQSVNTDTVPAMLTPGEFVVKRFAVEKFGAENLKAINNGTYSNGSVYNYNLSVNVKSESDPDKIARTVISQIKQVDSMRIRGNRI